MCNLVFCDTAYIFTITKIPAIRNNGTIWIKALKSIKVNRQRDKPIKRISTNYCNRLPVFLALHYLNLHCARTLCSVVVCYNQIDIIQTGVIKRVCYADFFAAGCKRTGLKVPIIAHNASIRVKASRSVKRDSKGGCTKISIVLRNKESNRQKVCCICYSIHIKNY